MTQETSLLIENASRQPRAHRVGLRGPPDAFPIKANDFSSRWLAFHCR